MTGGNLAIIQLMSKGKPQAKGPLSARMHDFVAILIQHPTMSQTDAAIRAGYSKRSAHVIACQLMNDARITDALAIKRRAMLAAMSLNAEDVLRDLYNVVMADPRDLSEYRVECCRYCFGEGHRYQRTPKEYRQAFKDYQASDAGRGDPLGLSFDHEGGVGFDRRRDPHPTCPECFGEGEGRVVIKDTRTLNPAARAFYGGVKETKNGVEIATRSKDFAVGMAARHLGVVRSSVEVTGKGGGPVQHVAAAVQLTTTDPIEAAREYQKLMGS